MKNIIEAAIKDYKYSNRLLVDGRKSTVKKALEIGLSKNQIREMRIKRFSRMKNNTTNFDAMTTERRFAFLKEVKECKFDLSANSSRYNCTGIDWRAYHRPSSSGGWVLIAPDEPSNNWHTNDNILVKYLQKKFQTN